MKHVSLIILIFTITGLRCLAQTEQDTLIVPTVILDTTNRESTFDTIISVHPSSIPDSVYINRLSQLSYEFELSYNPIVRRYIEVFTFKIRPRFEGILGASEFYFPIFEKILLENGLPPELRYLPVIESALNPHAVSRVHAVGLWQFMYSTGKENGLHIGSYVDERRALIASTEAAARYLKKLYGLYNDWQLALAAYNCGPGNVNRAIYRSGGKRNFWEIYPYLPRETRGYVPEFIAVAYACNYYKEHNLIPVPVSMPAQIDTVRIYQQLHLQQVSSVLGVDIKTLRQVNPQYTKDYIPASSKKYFCLTLPAEYKCKFSEMQDSVYSFKKEYYQKLYKTLGKEENGRIVHVVKSGECLSVIAERYHVSIAKIKHWNRISGNTIRKGQKLIIYAS